MTPYEQRALKRIRAWQAKPPGWGARLLAGPGGKLAQVVQDLVPESALRAALEGADKLGRRLSDERSILKEAGAASIAELRHRPLKACDQLARGVGRRASLLGGATGAAFGIAGAAGLVLDVPTLLTLALRTVHRVGICYGEQPRGGEERRLGLGVFALVSASSADEKLLALKALQADAESIDVAWREGAAQITPREMAKEAAAYSLQNLARSIGLNLGKRKAAETIPVIGALVGGVVNASYLSDIAETSRYVFQERWLEAHYPGQLPPADGTRGRA